MLVFCTDVIILEVFKEGSNRICLMMGYKTSCNPWNRLKNDFSMIHCINKVLGLCHKM
jgi:hypothetical protein